MIDALKKKLGITDAKEGAGLAVDMKAVGETIQTLTTATEAALADLATAQAALLAQTDVVASLTEQLATANAALAAVEAEKQAVLASAKEAKMTARKATLVTSIGEAKADALLLATENLDDAAFEAVTQAMVGAVAVEANGALFKEVGVDAQADATKPVQESGEMKLLREKYQAKAA